MFYGKKEVKEIISLLSFLLFLLSLSLFLVFNIIKDYVGIDTFLGGNFNIKKIYVLGNDKDYNYLKAHLKYRISKVDLSSKLSPYSVLFVLKPLSKKEKEKISFYLADGGSVIFNSKDKEFVSEITNLKKEGYLPFGNYRFISPSLSFVKVDKKIKCFSDIFLYKNKNSLVDIIKDDKYYPIMWSGKYYKGDWIYFSTPFYVLKNMNVLNQMVNYLLNKYAIVKYPFLNENKMVLISEYNYYKFDKNFINLINKFNLKATIFTKPKLVKKNYQNIEIASNILNRDKFKFDVEGYSNENKNIDITQLKSKGFRYTLGDKLKIDNNFVVLPNEGINDLYEKIDFNKVALRCRYGLFLLVIHPYILGYDKNSKILIKFLKQIQEYPVLFAKDIAKNILLANNIKIKAEFTSSNLTLKIKNENNKKIKKFTFRVYSSYQFSKVDSSFLNIKAKIIKQTKNYVDIQIEEIENFSEFSLFLRKK